METNQRKYRRIQRTGEQLEQDSPKALELTKNELRKLLMQRRTVIGPNGETIRIPKRMAVNDIIRIIKEEHGLSTAEITGILVTLKHLETNPEFRGKVNRVVANGIETPLRIERPRAIEGQVETVKPENIEIETGRTEQAEHKTNTADLGRQKGDTYSITLINEEEYRQRSAQINANIANRYREEAIAKRKADEERETQNKRLEKKLEEYYARQNKARNNRKRVGLAVAMLLGAIYITGTIGDMINTAKRAMTPEENLTPIQIQESTDSKLFALTPETIATFTKDINPFGDVSQTQAQEGYQKLDYSIDTVSQGLKTNTNLWNALNKFSATSKTPVVMGEIESYQDFEALLESGDNAIYTSGPAYFANFSRQMLHGMLKDKYGADRVVATYEKKGKDDEIYEFYVRYYKDGGSTARSMEGMVDMTRGEDGRLKTKEYHTLPYEVYELLAIIGEFSDFSSQEEGKNFDIGGYATRFTNGDVETAKQELKERMTYGVQAMKKLIKDRTREEMVQSYLHPER